jgi:hypothetical protein
VCVGSHPILGDETYGFKDWNDRFARGRQGGIHAPAPGGPVAGVAGRVLRPLLHAAELILPLPSPPSADTPATEGVLSQSRSAHVFVGADGVHYLRLRCSPPEDFSRVASRIIGGPLDLDSVLSPLTKTDERTKEDGDTGKCHESHIDPAMLAAGERDGWY